MSSKTCSLAVDEDLYEEKYSIEAHKQYIEPNLTVLVNNRFKQESSSDIEVIPIGGRINVSF